MEWLKPVDIRYIVDLSWPSEDKNYGNKFFKKNLYNVQLFCFIN